MNQSSIKRLREIKSKLKALSANLDDAELGQDLYCLSQDIDFVIGNERQEETQKPPIEIKAGVYCDDIPDEAAFNEVIPILTNLSSQLDPNQAISYSEYLKWGNVGVNVLGEVYHAFGNGNLENSVFTTRASYKDIIAAAKAIGE